MPQTYTKLIYHVVFGTKDRRPFIDPEIHEDLHAYLGGIIRELGGHAIMLNGVSDHVHILMTLPPTISLSDAVRTIKTNSSKWIHEKWPARKEFGWQAGYGAFSVSQSAMEDVSEYISKQQEHHRKLSFTDEFIALLKRHQIDYDPKYVSD